MDLDSVWGNQQRLDDWKKETGSIVGIVKHCYGSMSSLEAEKLS